MQDTAVDIKGLIKEYPIGGLFRKRSVRAVDDLNLTINSGEIFGLLGPNGAGKTTTLNLITGFLTPTEGQIKLFGQLLPQSIEARYKIGYLPETPDLPGYLKAKELLDFYAGIFQIPPGKRRERIEAISDSLGLKDRQNTRINNLSIGQKRVLGLAQTLINQPELLILDEPTVYLDPLIKEKFVQIISKLKQSQKTVIISSHILSDIEKLCDRIAIINKARLIKIVTKEEIRRFGSLEELFLEAVKEE